ncbi:MAG: LOG family protein [Nitrospinae bacterium]|nr:LOG family protein [Nitrospinota bacterium]MZH42568.1 LOG family protein [Nitrospinota bacterium]
MKGLHLLQANMNQKDNNINQSRIEELVLELSQLMSPNAKPAMFEEIFADLALIGSEHKDEGDHKLLHKAISELRRAFKVFLPYRNKRKVAIFGSGRVSESHPNYKLALELAQKLVVHDYQVITGAGGGVMEAANKGAGRENSFGLNINLPMEQTANAFIENDPHLIEFKYFFTRKLVFIKESSATVLLPGGLGTLDEGIESLTLFQTGKCMPRPIILLEQTDGNYWDCWMDFFNSMMVEQGFADKSDINLVYKALTVEQAIGHIINYYKVFHSLRYIGDLTIMRLTKSLSSDMVKDLNHEFQDIILKGSMHLSPPHKLEIKNNEFLELPRLSLHFINSKYGRLNQLIEAINKA